MAKKKAKAKKAKTWTKPELGELLRRLEWQTQHRVCPSCSRRQPQGHDPACELADALRSV